MEDIILEPQEQVESLKQIGAALTETLEWRAAGLVRKRVMRYKYAARGGGGVLIADRLPCLMDNGVAETRLLVHLPVGKFADHWSYYRQLEILQREVNRTLAGSTVPDRITAH